MVAGSHNNVTDTQLGWIVVSATRRLLLTSLSGLVVLLLYDTLLCMIRYLTAPGIRYVPDQ